MRLRGPKRRWRFDSVKVEFGESKIDQVSPDFEWEGSEEAKLAKADPLN
jgi:hypothetical protein